MPHLLIPIRSLQFARHAAWAWAHFRCCAAWLALFPLLGWTAAAIAQADAQATDEPPRAGVETTSPPTVKPRLELHHLYGGDALKFEGEYARDLRWSAAGPAYLDRRDGVLMRVEAVTDAATPAFDYVTLAAALRNAGIEESVAEELGKEPGDFEDGAAAVLIAHGARRFVYRFEDARLRELPVREEQRRIEQLSPGGRFVSFVRENDLYVMDAEAGTERRLTADGGEARLNGLLDWVYQEEIYGRGDYQGHWWRDDDGFIAFLQFDESAVPLYTIADQSVHPPRVQRYHYPKVGEPNPVVRLGVIRPTGGDVRWVDLSAYDRPQDLLIVRVGWATDGRLVFQVQDRAQTWLDLCDADPADGRVRRLLRDRTAAWVEPREEPHWLADGSFLWLSERDGFMHLYHHARDGRLIRRLTRGDWEVRELHGADEKGGWVYFSGTRDGLLQLHAYRAPLGGGSVTRLTEPGRSHRVAFDADFRLFIDTSGTALSPPRVELRQADGRLIRTISANERSPLHDFELGEVSFHEVPARDGCRLPAMMIRPPGFDPAVSYPVWVMTYGGPHSPEVADRWNSRRMPFRQFIAQRGFIVWQIDPRSASGRGAASAWQAFGRLGLPELDDIEDSLEWLRGQGVIGEATRVGIEGYSYGGFLVCLAAVRSERFDAVIAGGPVTDWRFYDSIYTERYMGLLAENEAAYDACSPLRLLEKLRDPPANGVATRPASQPAAEPSLSNEATAESGAARPDDGAPATEQEPAIGTTAPAPASELTADPPTEDEQRAASDGEAPVDTAAPAASTAPASAPVDRTDAPTLLRARLLLAHGVVDDNVHFQNTLLFIRALQKRDVLFETTIYPKDEHSLHVGARHYAAARLDFMTRHLRPPPPPQP
ncbi:MAG: DPP IV N-terminal domain-containing protein [Planctomycetia bacterium]|nr:MAG: DPP IV N-terminal domain-containing protein [Planctomycetia bacterium]